MIEPDTIKLLRECDAGIRMGIDSIEVVVDEGTGEGLRKCLADCKEEHEKLKSEIQQLLNQYQDEGKEPGTMAKGMSWMKTNMKLAMAHRDETIADLMTDGCNMGVKSLHKYLNQYKAASEQAKNITKRLINLEEKLTADLHPFL